MNKYILILLTLVSLAFGALPALAQGGSGTIKGVCTDSQGQPIAGGIVDLLNTDNGRKYQIKTNKKGEYFSLGIEPGIYNLTLSKDGKELFHEDRRKISLSDENVVDFNLKEAQERAAKGVGLTPEQLKAQQEAKANQEKEVTTVKSLNEKLAAANQSIKAGDYDSAVSTLTEANQVDPNRDAIWASLGDAYAGSAMKQTDPAEKTKRLEQGIQDYQKAVELKKKGMEAGATPGDAVKMAAIYNNMARAKANDGKVDDAIADYNQAAQLNPAAAGMYYFNLGATLTNANKSGDAKIRKDAIEAFDKAIAADPNHADAYYYKGTSLIGEATLQDGKMVAPEGTAEAFNKYLELQPTGPHAEDAKSMLAAIGAKVETSFGNQTKKKPTKK